MPLKKKNGDIRNILLYNAMKLLAFIKSNLFKTSLEKHNLLQKNLQNKLGKLNLK